MKKLLTLAGDLKKLKLQDLNFSVNNEVYFGFETKHYRRTATLQKNPFSYILNNTFECIQVINE